MASYVQYKTIIASAIGDFNTIQSAIGSHGATYNGSVIGTPVNNSQSTLVPTALLGGIISDQLQLKAAGELTLTTSNVTTSSGNFVASVVISEHQSYASVKLTAGAVSTPATTITPNALSGSWVAASNKYEVTQASKSQSVTPSVTTAGWITAGTAGTVTVAAPTKLTIDKATLSASGKRVTVATAGYLPAGEYQDVSDGTVTLAKSGDIAVTNSLEVIASDGANAGVNAEDIFAKTGNAYDYSTSEPSAAGSYYIALKPSSTGGSATVNTDNSGGAFTAGYVANKPASVTVSTSHSNNTTYYYKLNRATVARDGTSGSVKVTSSGYLPASDTPIFTLDNASGFALALTDQSSTNLSVGSLSGGYYSFSTSLSGNVSASTPGYYDGSNKAVTDSSVVVGRLAAATFNNATSQGSTSAISNLTAQTTYVAAGYVPAGKITVRSGSFTNNATLDAIIHDESDSLPGQTNSSGGTTGTLQNIFLAAAPSTGDYYEIKATASNTMGTTGWISSAAGDATATKYLPKAKLTYTTDSTTGADLLTVSTAGYLPLGVISDVASVSGTLDEASIPNFTLSTTPTGSGPYVFTGSASMAATGASAGYITTSTTMPTATLTLAKATVTGGTLGTANYTGSTTADANNTLSASSNDYLLTSGTNSYSFTINGTKTEVTRGAVTTGTVGYLPSGTQISADSAIVGTQSKTFYIKAGTKGVVSPTLGYTAQNNTVTASGGAARNFSTTSAASAAAQTNGATSSNKTYVSISATPSATVSAGTAGWFANDTNSGTGSASSIYLAAVNSPTVAVSGSLTNNTTATTFNNETGAIQTAGNKTVSGSLSGGISNQYKDTYIINGLTVTTGNVSDATISATATGSEVDSDFESLYKRMLGQVYTDVTV